MGRIVQPARTPGGTVPDIRYMEYASGQTFIRGALVIYESGSTGDIVTAGVNPTSIVGVALQGADTAPGFAAANSPAVFTYRNRKVSVALANRTEVFRSSLTNGSSTVVTPAQTDVGASYGVTAYSGEWTVDRAKTGVNARVQVVGIDTAIPGGTGDVFWKFLESAIAVNP